MDTDLTSVKILDYLSRKIEEGLCLAFSGGVDSALLLYYLAECRLEGENVLAATFDTVLHPREDFALTRYLADLYNIKHLVIPADVFKDEALQYNPPDRCYRCKSLLFTRLKEVATDKKLRWILDGTNADDMGTYRPGIKALQELGICSPWAELGVTKAKIRQLAEKAGLPVARRPSTPCMATRFPYGAKLDVDVMQRLNVGEGFIRDLKIETVRLRYYDGLVRIEVHEDDFSKLLWHKDEIVKALKKLNFRYITLDLEGFRSGSMDNLLLN